MSNTLPIYQTLLLSSLSPGTLLMEYNQPKISNAFTLQQYHDLASALQWARSIPSIRVLVLTGQGKHYCAGKVLLPPGTENGPTIEQEIEAGQRLGAELQGYPKVLIAAVHGAAIGWGCTQLWNFDLVYAWDKGAVFQTPFMQLGFVPEGASSWSFPKVMGKQRANALLLASEKLNAREMYDAGLVTKVIESDTLERFREEVFKIARRIGTYSAESLRMAKAQVNRPSVLAEQREAGMWEAVDLKIRLNSDEAKEAMSKFAEKGKKETKSKL
jgi:peroxisomal 3,2-trans-enoyl-CoA isomerase